jgi:hypothetical protein
MFRDPSGMENVSHDGGNNVVHDTQISNGEQPNGLTELWEFLKSIFGGSGNGGTKSAGSATPNQSTEAHVTEFNRSLGSDLANTKGTLGAETPGIGNLGGGPGVYGNPTSTPHDTKQQQSQGNPTMNNPSNSLPTYQKMYDNYPKDENGDDLKAKKVYELVGGDVLKLFNTFPEDYQNACALRVSYALNKSGVNIPKGKTTVKGEDGKNYYLSAAELNKWLFSYFGKPDLELSKNFKENLNGNKGIYVMIPNYPGDQGFGASGHATLFTGTDCISSLCYLNAKRGVYRVYLWSLQ